MRIRILCVGRSKERWLLDALEFYTQRARPYVQLLWEECSDEGPLLKAAADTSAFGLDPQGTLYESRAWSQWMLQSLEEHGGHLTLCIGGADGFSERLRALLAKRLISLSPLTMTHQIVRVVLAEQIYRAVLIAHGHPYHR